MSARPRCAGFDLQDLIGAGGSAVVYRAVSRTFGGVVALKLWRAPLTPFQRPRFAQECALQWELSGHPHVVRMYWADIPAEDPPWIALELYEQSLADRLLSGPALTAPEAFTFAEHLLLGLAAVHRRNRVHRDVKPANVLIKEGRAALADLGIAKHLDEWTQDRAAGSDAFLAPELRRGAPPSQRSDVYSAAVTIRRIYGADLPPPVESVLTRAASHHPQDRPADAEALLAALLAADSRTTISTATGTAAGGGSSAWDLALDLLLPDGLIDTSP